MPTMNDERAAAGARYAAAVNEFRAAFVELAAWDQILRRPGFGYSVDVVALRHSEFAPTEGGLMTDDVNEAILRLTNR